MNEHDEAYVDRMQAEHDSRPIRRATMTKTATKVPATEMDAVEAPTTNVVTIPAPASDSGAMMSMIQRFATDPAVDVGKLEKLLDLRNQQRDYDARVEFDNAMSAAQEEMDPVRKNAKGDKAKYASYDALDGAIRDIYTKHGFAVSYNTAESKLVEHVKVLARLSHRVGHREHYQIDMPADGKGAKGNDVMTKTHATGSAYTYGKRYLLAGMFNIAITNDDDGGAAGHKGTAGMASGGGEFRPERRTTVPANYVEAARQDGTLDETRKKGEMPAKPGAAKELTPQERRAAKIAKGVNDRITALRAKNWTKFELADFWHENKVWIDWMDDPKNQADAEYQRFYTVYSSIESNARDV